MVWSAVWMTPELEEQPLDVVAPVKGHGQLSQFLRLEGGADDVVGLAVGTVGAVVFACVGQQHLEQRHTAAVLGPGVADAAEAGVAHPLAAIGPLDAAGGARHVIARRFAQNSQFFHQIHIKLPHNTIIVDVCGVVKHLFVLNDPCLDRAFNYDYYVIKWWNIR